GRPATSAAPRRRGTRPDRFRIGRSHCGRPRESGTYPMDHRQSREPPI
ncbi:MAG: hypothetical protein AVDCRST_MAG73-1470, partial [uncultured Thermomicrobiales bacterium]